MGKDYKKTMTKKKIGDLYCKEIECEDCPLHCLNCNWAYGNLYEKANEMFDDFPELKPMRKWVKNELEKEVETK